MTYYYLLNDASPKTWPLLHCKEPVILKINRELLAPICTPLSNVDILLLVKNKSARIFLFERSCTSGKKAECPWHEVNLEGKRII
jgi:hypothetical protein